MNTPLSLLLSPTGCYHSVPGGMAVPARESDGYIKDSCTQRELSLNRLKKHPDVGASKVTVALRAAVEVHVAKHDVLPAFRRLSFSQKTAVILAALRNTKGV